MRARSVLVGLGMPSLLVAHRQEIVRAGIEVLLQSAHYTIVARASCAQDVLYAAARYQPDIVMLGQHIGEKNWTAFLRELRSRCVSVRTVILCGRYDNSRLPEIIRLKVDGLISTDVTADRLRECVRQVQQGHRWVDPEVLSPLVSPGLRSDFSELTSREVEVSDRVSLGLRNSQIALELNISEATVKMHLHRVYEKLRIGSRTELALVAQSARNGHALKERNRLPGDDHERFVGHDPGVGAAV